MPDCDRCIYMQDIQWLKDEAKKNSEVHQKIFDKLENQGTAQALIDERYRNIMQNLSELKSDMEELKSKPTKRYDTVVTALLSSGVGGLAGFILSKLLGA